MVLTRRQSTSNRNVCEPESVCSLPSTRTRRRSPPRRGRYSSRRQSLNCDDSCADISVPDVCQNEPVPDVCQNEPVPDVCQNDDTTGLFQCCEVQFRYFCFYVLFIITCILLAIVIFSVVSSYSSTLSQIEGLKEEINTLRNEILANKQYDGIPTKPRSIDANIISNDLINTIEHLFTSENQKTLDELKQLIATAELIVKLLGDMQKDISKTMGEKGHYSLATASMTARKATPQNMEERVDYAAESLGGEIISTDNTQLLKMYYFGSLFGWIENTPRMIIQPSMFPGECYGFIGQIGSVVIKLMARVFIDSVTIGHIPRELSPSGDLNSAPCDIIVSGLSTPHDAQPTELATISYDIDIHEIYQTFPVTTGIVSFQYIRFNFTSNHGNPNHTCVYRVRVHGRLDDS